MDLAICVPFAKEPSIEREQIIPHVIVLVAQVLVVLMFVEVHGEDAIGVVRPRLLSCKRFITRFNICRNAMRSKDENTHR